MLKVERIENNNIKRIDYFDSIKIVGVMLFCTIALPYVFLTVGIKSPFLYSLFSAIIFAFTPIQFYKKQNKKVENLFRLFFSVIIFIILYSAVKFNIIF